mmetsp:Transcript_15325/g.44347  ORF Transcript_15325/g.44347 Transcript_15325/m.44347 type:complete len:82 (-) Transcript_15325:37-282(-)
MMNQMGNANVSGRAMGHYVPNWNFAFFDHDHDSLGNVPTEHEYWIAVSLRFYQDGTNETTKDGVPNIIMGGSGSFLDSREP